MFLTYTTKAPFTYLIPVLFGRLGGMPASRLLAQERAKPLPRLQLQEYVKPKPTPSLHLQAEAKPQTSSPLSEGVPVHACRSAPGGDEANVSFSDPRGVQVHALLPLQDGAMPKPTFPLQGRAIRLSFISWKSPVPCLLSNFRIGPYQRLLTQSRRGQSQRLLSNSGREQKPLPRF